MRFVGEVAVGPSVQLSAVSAVTITEQLARRGESESDYLKQKIGIQDLAHEAGGGGQVLPHLVQRALEICKSDTAGISVYESAGSVFRWHHVAGALAELEGATTPRDFSPCGVCLDERAAVLMERPERAYPWIGEVGIIVPEVLLVPIFVGDEPFGTLWIIAHEGQKLNLGHARVMTELAGFAGLALQVRQTERALNQTD